LRRVAGAIISAEFVLLVTSGHKHCSYTIDTTIAFFFALFLFQMLRTTLKKLTLLNFCTLRKLFAAL